MKYVGSSVVVLVFFFFFKKKIIFSASITQSIILPRKGERRFFSSK
jgi:hypothetical protein